AKVRNAGRAAPQSDQSIWATWDTIIKPTTTSAGATASKGTRWISGVKNMAARNNNPVTTEDKPVRAPSPMPVPDSTKIWVDDAEPAPPAVTPIASTSSTRLSRGIVPSLSTLPASRDSPTEVPIASKNTDSKMAKISKDAAVAPTEENAPNEKLPNRLKSGVVQSGMAGVTRLHPSGLTFPASSTEGPMWNTSSKTLAIIVAPTMPIRIAPRTRCTTKTAVSINPMTNTSVGQPASSPLIPSPNGTVVSAASGIRRTKPEFTSPISVINKPIPTTMPVLMPSGTARNTASRNPVSTKMIITAPAITTSPIASGQVRFGVVAMVMANNALTPSPAARPKG